MSKNFKSIENSIARYIYIKYIMQKQIIKEEQTNSKDESINEDAGNEDAGNEDAGNEDAGNEDAGNEELNVKNIAKIDNKLYKIYLQRIFDFERHSFRILQEDVLKEDLKNMAIADKAYELNPKNFNPSEYDSLPDVLRCSFIRKSKHRYYRCRNKVINDDSDICKKHENSENIYIDRYNELIDIMN